jgi:integrase
LQSTDHIARYQKRRLAEAAGPKTINLEVATLRAVLRKHRLWANLQPDVKPLRTREDVGRALSDDEKHRLLAACGKSRSRSLYPAVLLSLHSGLRSSELRLLRWHQVDLLERTVTVGKSKTAGGEGRVIPLSNMALQTMKNWRSRLILFSRQSAMDWTVRRATRMAPWFPTMSPPAKPITSWKTAWTKARGAAGVSCRWHDMRHDWLTMLGESGASDSTIVALAAT